MSKNNGKIWTIKDEYGLLELALNNTNILDIADIIGRTPKACCARIHKLLPKSGDDKDTLIKYLISIPIDIYDYLLTIRLRHLRYINKITT